jgi:flagellar biogenesis protein FliO
MINAILLIFDPANTWERIEKSQRNVWTVFFLFLVPLLLFVSALEGYALVRFGEAQGGIIERVVPVSRDLAIRYEAVQFSLSLLIIFGGAWLLKKTGESFHRRHTYKEAFTILAYSLSPLFLMRILDGWPVMNTWICWGIGIFLSVAALYRGVPRIMKPDPSNALGVYLLGAMMLILITGLAHFLAVQVLEEKILTNGWRLSFG